MRVLIVSDLHANPAALAVLPVADATVCAGDLVDYGPDPAAAIAWCRERRATVVTGNHDFALSHDADCGVKGTMREASVQTRRAHRSMLGPDDIAYLRELPKTAVVSHGGATFALAHAVPDDVYPYEDLASAGHRLRDAVPEADVFVLGHTHVQGRIDGDGKIVVNPGSVGVSNLGRTVHFALWEDGRLSLHAVPYDAEAAIAKLRALPLDAAAFEPLANALRNGRDTTRR